MPEHQLREHALHENLDTAYVSVGALLRYLRERNFHGRIHVELDEYAADVYLAGAGEPYAVERDFATGREEESTAALHRLLVRAREPGGLVSVYESDAASVRARAGESQAQGAGRDNVRLKSGTVAEAAARASAQQAKTEAEEADERREVIELSGELMAAVERAAQVAGGDFASAFHRARIQLADDYPFLDPAQRRFAYAEGRVALQGKASTGLYVSGVCEALRLSVEYIANDRERIGVRRDVARELSTLARRRQTLLNRYKFMPHLERIAGMRLL